MWYPKLISILVLLQLTKTVANNLSSKDYRMCINNDLGRIV